MRPNSCEFVVGHLLEVRAANGFRSVADVDQMLGVVRSTVSKLSPDVKFAIAADWRAVGVMAPETSVRAREMFASLNPHVTRSGILTLPENPTTNLQVVRLIREAESANRRHFTSAAELHAWVSEALTPEESRRLRRFLDLPPG